MLYSAGWHAFLSVSFRIVFSKQVQLDQVACQAIAWSIHSDETMQNTRTWRKFLCSSLDEVAAHTPTERGGRADDPYSPQTVSMSTSGSRRPVYAATEVRQLTKSVPHPDHLIVLSQELTNQRLRPSSRTRGGQDHVSRLFQGVGRCCNAFVLELRKSDEVSGRFLEAKLSGPSTAGAIQSSDAR